jgi:zinc transporter ZupT
MALYLLPTAALFVVAFGISAGVTLSEVTNRKFKHVLQIFIWGTGFAVVGFVGGLFGPVLLSTSPQGPLLGIFLTGPAGAVLGCVFGALRSVRLSHRHDALKT